MTLKYGRGVSLDPRRRKDPFVVRMKCFLTGKFLVIGYYSDLEEARVVSDKALIRRYLTYGVPTRKLNYDESRRAYIEEVTKELLELVAQPRTREMLPMWFLMSPNYVVEETVDDELNNVLFTDEDLDEIIAM